MKVLNPSSKLILCVTRNTLQDEPATYGKELSSMLYFMDLRARANSQRFYEGYLLETSPEIAKEDLEDLFKDSPQMIVDLIRKKGVKQFSYRRAKETSIIN